MSPYQRLVAASGLSNLADGVFQIALPLVALGITRDPGAFASVSVVARLPWLIFALPAGALADRLDRRVTMYRVSFVRTALIGALAAVVSAGWEELWILYVIALALGFGETMFDTAAQSILPNIVKDPDQLSRANGRLYAVELTANQFIGPPLGGLIAGLTLAGALSGSAIAYLGAALFLLVVRGQFRPERTGPPTRLRTDIREGVSFLWHNRVLRTMALCVGLSNLAYTAMFSVFPLFVVDPGPMGLSEAGFGLLITATAVGSVLASPLVEWFERRLGRTGTLLFSSALFPLAPLTAALTAAVAPNAVVGVLSGLSIVLWNVITVSLRQRISPDHMLGRVNAGYRLLAWGTMPVGAALGGVLGEVLGLQGTFAVCAALGFLGIPLLLSGVSEESIAAAEQEAHDRAAAATT